MSLVSARASDLSALRGGLSLPSRKACKNNLSMPRLRARSSIASMWSSWLWIPPGDSKPMICNLAFALIALSTDSVRTRFEKKPPSFMSLSILVRFWYTTLPEPKFIWPTSELPIWPAGSPTDSPEVSIKLLVCSDQSLSQWGLSAALIALFSASSRWPHPSKINKTEVFLSTIKF